jgi:hypothetical protein
MPQSHTISIAPHKRLRGVVNILALDPVAGEAFGLDRKGKEVHESMVCADLGELETRTHDSDAHFTCYGLRIDGEENDFAKCPRINKASLAHIRAEGGEVVMSAIALDWDLKDYFQRDKEDCAWATMSDEDKKQAWTVFVDALNKMEENGFPWNLFYTTPHGMRIVHAFPEVIPAGKQFEALAADLRAKYLHAGLECDEACKDWTRLFRAPGVTLEDGTETWTQEWFKVVAQWDTFMEQPEIDEEIEKAIEISALTGDQPTPEEAKAQIEFLAESGQWNKTNEVKKAKRRLGREDFKYFDAIFGDKLLASKGDRHNTVLALVGSLLKHLHGLEWSSPEFLYGLAYDAVHKAGGDHLGQLWENIQSLWAQEDGKAAVEKVEVEQKEEVREQREMSEREMLLEGVREWLPELEDMPDGEAMEFLKANRFGIIRHATKNLYHILRGDGYYRTMPCCLDAMRQSIREAGMEWFIPLTFMKEDDQGRMTEQEIRADKIRDAHCRTFSKAGTDILQEGSYLTVDEHGVGTFHEVPFALRTDIEAEFHEEVHEWLSCLVEPDEFEAFTQAIGCFLAIDEGPTAALSVVGPARCGKTLLGAGLGECFTDRSHVPGDVLVSKFNASLLDSPIIWVDEGVPKKADYDFADQFRKVVSGGGLSIEKKGLERVPMDNVHRVVMTANNSRLLTSVIGTDARTDMDMGAISERVTHFIARQKGADFLHSIGGRNGTHGWIKGDEASLDIVAKHFMWLYEELERDERGLIKRPSGQRLLCQGKADESVMHTAQALSGYTPELVGFLNRHINSKKNDFVVYDGESVYIRHQAVVTAMMEDRHNRNAVQAAIGAMFSNAAKKDFRPVKGAKPAKWKACEGEVFARHVAEIGEEFKPREAERSGKNKLEDL